MDLVEVVVGAIGFVTVVALAYKPMRKNKDLILKKYRIQLFFNFVKMLRQALFYQRQ